MRDEPSSSRLIVWTCVALGAAALAFAPVAWVGYRQSKRAQNERHASATLKTLASAEADFRGNDRDNNGIQDYWTADVASLYDMVPVGGSVPLRLIDPALAAADPSRPGAVPYRGYWFTVIALDEEGTPYVDPDLKGRNYSKFGFCAYPAGYGRTGTATFMINEGNTIFKEDLQGAPKKQWPSDDYLKSFYTKIE